MRFGAVLAAVAALAGFSYATSAGSTPEVRRVSFGIGDTVVTTSFSATPPNDAASPVVLVPGLLGAAFTFRNLAPALSEAGHRVIIIEPLGIGGSSRPKDADYSLESQATRLGRALDTLGISNATFVCH